MFVAASLLSPTRSQRTSWCPAAGARYAQPIAHIAGTLLTFYDRFQRVKTLTRLNNPMAAAPSCSRPNRTSDNHQPPDKRVHTHGVRAGGTFYYFHSAFLISIPLAFQAERQTRQKTSGSDELQREGKEHTGTLRMYHKRARRNEIGWKLIESPFVSLRSNDFRISYRLFKIFREDHIRYLGRPASHLS